jgi:membrane fusion protein (multidrug efflux system)
MVAAGWCAPSASRGQSAEVDALKREVEALRQKITDLERKKVQAEEAPKVVVTSPLAADVVDTQRYNGTIQAQSHIQIRPQVGGYLEEVLVKEGQAVKKGDALFKILPTLYQSKLDIEQAEVQAALIELKVAENLFKNKTVSQNELSLAQAKLAKAEAKAKVARIELGFTVVLSPFDGVVGRLQVQEGGLAKEGDVLTTLSDNSALRVYFNVPEVRYLEYKASLATAKQEPQVELVLASGAKLPGTSHLTAVESKSDSIAFRADVPNPEHLLLHGQQGQVHIRRTLQNVIVIPQRATFELNDKRYVLVVGKDDVAHLRAIEVRLESGEVFVISKGLDAKDKFILEGFRQVRDGERVKHEFRSPEEVLPDVQKHAAELGTRDSVKPEVLASR